MKKIAIYCFYDDKGIVRDFVLYYLESLNRVIDDIWVVANCELTPESRVKLRQIRVNVIERENRGFDVLAWKETMETIGWDTLKQYDELVLCNYTCYGPVYPFEEMFDKMANVDCDFWGIVKHPEQPSYLLPQKQGYIYEHIMSFFIVIKNKLLSSEDFKNYWRYMPEINTKADAVGKNETRFTKYFEDLGYTSASYVNLDDYEGRCYNSSIILANELVKNSRCPLVKRRAFFFPEYDGLIQISDTRQTIDLINFLEKETDYNTDLIWEDILGTQKISTLVNNMHLGNVLSSQSICSNHQRKILIAIFIPEKIYADILDAYLKLLNKDYVINLYYADDEIGDYCREKLGQYVASDNMVKILIQADEIGLACLKEIKPHISDFDYICCLFNYNTINQNLSIGKEDWINYIYTNTIGSIPYINNIINLFENNKRLGMVIPRESNFSSYFGQTFSKVKKNLPAYKRAYDQMNLGIPFDDGVFTNGMSTFWLSKDSAERFINAVIKNGEVLYKTKTFEFFAPMLIQSIGYFVSPVISNEYASLCLDHHQFMKHKFLEKVNTFVNGIPWTFYSCLNSIKEKEVLRVEKNIDRKEILETHFSFRELLLLLRKYPSHKKENFLSRRKSKNNDNVPIYTYLRNVSIEDNRLLLYFMCGKEVLKDGYLLLNQKKYYAKSNLNTSQNEVTTYVKEYSQAFAVFFELPIAELKNSLIQIFQKDGTQIYFKWASGISYNALELSKLGLYSRITNEGYWIQDKHTYVKEVFSSKKYSVKDKVLFLFLKSNKIHNITMLSENLGAADNTFQLFKYALKQKQKKVYYVVSKEIYDTEKDSTLKKRMVIHNSRKHHFLMMFSKLWIGSYSLRGELFTTTDVYKDIHMNMIPAEWIFIPHGMAVGDKSVAMLHSYAWDNPQMTFTSSKDECVAYANIYGFKNVTYLGSPRMDKWKNVTINNNEIMIFFTWRMGLSKGRVLKEKSFEDSSYFRILTSLVKKIRKDYPNRIIHYVFHHEIVKMGYDSKIKSALKDEKVNFIDFSSTDEVEKFNNCFATSKYLITDFSSVAYDFAYKENAITIYYLQDEFIKYHYPLEQKFFDMQLGEIAYTLDDLSKALKLSSPTLKMEKRRKQFFYELDDNNSQRVYNAIFNNQFPQNTEWLNKKQLNNNIKRSINKRLCIYFFYDKDGIVDKYVFYYLQEIKKFCDEICVVINGQILDVYKNQLEKSVNKVIVRENIGFDSWAYKKAIETYGYEKIADNFDELILNNFTNYGPIHPFEKMFAVMDKKECDFWGHNKYIADENQKFDDMPMPDHFQSYFMAFRKNLLKSEDFKKYWCTLSLPSDYLEAVKFHELRCTRYFEELGYISSEYIPYNAYPPDFGNTSVYMAYSLLQKYNSPFLKRKIFTIENGKFAFPLWGKESVYDLLEYIKVHTQYDINLLYENIVRTQNIETDTCDEDIQKINELIANYKKDNIQDIDEKKINEMNNQIFSKKLLLEKFERR